MTGATNVANKLTDAVVISELLLVTVCSRGAEISAATETDSATTSVRELDAASSRLDMAAVTTAVAMSSSSSTDCCLATALAAVLGLLVSSSCCCCLAVVCKEEDLGEVLPFEARAAVAVGFGLEVALASSRRRGLVGAGTGVAIRLGTVLVVDGFFTVGVVVMVAVGACLTEIGAE